MVDTLITFLVAPTLLFAALAIGEFAFLSTLQESIKKSAIISALICAGVVALFAGILFKVSAPGEWQIASNGWAAIAVFIFGCTFMFQIIKIPYVSLVLYGVFCCFVAGVLSQ